MDELNLNSHSLTVESVLRGRLNFETNRLEFLTVSRRVCVLKDSRSKFKVKSMLGNVRVNISFVGRVF